MQGRPTLLTADTQARFCKAIEGGATQAMAEAVAGLGRRTSALWMAKGKAQETGIYRDFYDAAMRAREIAGTRWLVKLQQLADAKQDWRAYQWLLKVNFPGTFGDAAIAEDVGVVEALPQSPALQMLDSLRSSGFTEAQDDDLMALDVEDAAQ